MGPAPGTTLAVWYWCLHQRHSVFATFADYAAAVMCMPATVEAFRSGGIEVVLAGLRDGTTRFSWPQESQNPGACCLLVRQNRYGGTESIGDAPGQMPLTMDSDPSQGRCSATAAYPAKPVNPYPE